MNKKQCREALDLYKKFLIRMDRVGEFLKVAENVGIDKGEIPDLTKVSRYSIGSYIQHPHLTRPLRQFSFTPVSQTASMW